MEWQEISIWTFSCCRQRTDPFSSVGEAVSIGEYLVGAVLMRRQGAVMRIGVLVR